MQLESTHSLPVAAPGVLGGTEAFSDKARQCKGDVRIAEDADFAGTRSHHCKSSFCFCAKEALSVWV